MHCSKGHVHRPAADNIAAASPAACTHRCVRAQRAACLAIKPRPHTCTAARLQATACTICRPQQSSTSHRWLHAVACSSVPESSEPVVSIFTPEYVDRLQQLQPMMTPETVRHLQATLPVDELPQLQQLLEDLDSLASGWYLLEDAQQGAEQAATVAGQEESQQPPASFDSYLREVVFAHVADDQLDELLDFMGRDTLKSIGTLYEDIVRFQQQPQHDPQQLQLKYEQLSERMAAVMQQVMMEGSSSDSGDSSSQLGPSTSRAAQLPEPVQAAARENSMNSMHSNSDVGSTVATSKPTQQRRSKSKSFASRSKSSGVAVSQLPGSRRNAQHAAGSMAQAGSVSSEQGGSWVNAWSSTHGGSSASTPIAARADQGQAEASPDRKVPRVQLVHALSQPQVAWQRSAQQQDASTASHSHSRKSAAANNDVASDDGVASDQEPQGQGSVPASQSSAPLDWLVKQPPSSAWAWAMQRPSPGGTVGASAKQAAMAAGASRSSSRSASRQSSSLKTEDSVSA